MKKLLSAPKDERLTTQLKRTAFVFAVGLTFGFAFWVACAPMASAAVELTPTEMIQSKLPPTKTLATATKQEVLDAVCAAVKKWRKDAPQIVRTAAGARKEFAGDIVTTALRCLKQDYNCDLIEKIYAIAISLEPDKTSWYTDLVIEIFPDCRDAIGRSGATGEGEFGDPPPNVNPPPGTGGGGGGGFDPQGGQCQVCHQGTTLTISCNDAQTHLNHGDTVGACPPTPVQNP